MLVHLSPSMPRQWFGSSSRTFEKGTAICFHSLLWEGKCFGILVGILQSTGSGSSRSSSPQRPLKFERLDFLLGDQMPCFCQFSSQVVILVPHCVDLGLQVSSLCVPGSNGFLKDLQLGSKRSQPSSGRSHREQQTSGCKHRRVCCPRSLDFRIWQDIQFGTILLRSDCWRNRFRGSDWRCLCKLYQSGRQRTVLSSCFQQVRHAFNKRSSHFSLLKQRARWLKQSRGSDRFGSWCNTTQDVLERPVQRCNHESISHLISEGLELRCCILWRGC
mmetsp:Transcript_73276/g.152929  ORF Transcript_73276/g.152929 Transcript_73276/m.152929 type:complete len:274 (+) Transcript_73276:85-906(+)